MHTFWKYCREQLPAQVATFWMVAAFYMLGFGLVLAFLQIDAEFSRPLAGGVVPEHVTQHLAWAVRAFSVIVGMAAMYCHVHAMPRFRNMLLWMGGIAAVLLFLHALGISAKIMEGQYGRAAAITEIETATTDTSAAQVATLQKQIDDITAAKDAQVTRLQKSIDNLTTDKLDNDDLADKYLADQTKAETDAAALIQPLRDQITTLTIKSGETVVKATEDKTKVDSFNPLFTFMARVFSWTWDPAKQPTETLQFGLGFAFLTLFFGFGEILMMACFTIAYGMQIIVAAQKAKPEPVEAIPEPVNDDAEDTKLTRSEIGRMGNQAMQMNRKIRGMDKRIAVGEGAAA
jgi:hypothetical protein